MNSMLKRRIVWTAVLSGVHLLLYQWAHFLSDTFAGVIGFLSWLPWLPLAWADVAVASQLLPMPTALGLLWCAAVWLVIYWLLAGKLAKLPNSSFKADGSAAA
jgi:hypothetical protein